MYSLNRVEIIGYQTQPVTLRKTPSGTNVTDLNLVAPYSFAGENGTTMNGKAFFTVTAWGPMAEVAARFVKAGSNIFIAGRLQTDSWEDEKTKEKRSKTKIVALDMILLDPKDGQLQSPPNAKKINACVNRAEVIGHVTRDPEMRTTTGGKQVLTLGVATNDRWKDKASGEDRERAEFHSVVIWGDLADEVAKHVKKGNRVYCGGRVQTRTWETKDGQKRATTEIVADAVSLLGVKNPVADTVIQTSGSAVASTEGPSMPVTSGSVEVPEIAYASEVKVEDLPF